MRMNQRRTGFHYAALIRHLSVKSLRSRASYEIPIFPHSARRAYESLEKPKSAIIAPARVARAQVSQVNAGIIRRDIGRIETRAPP